MVWERVERYIVVDVMVFVRLRVQGGSRALDERVGVLVEAIVH